MAKKFIKTTDESTANKLLSEGFKLISQIGNVYTFLNFIDAVLFELV